MELKLWVAGARPRTLPAAVVPVVVGTAIAISAGKFSPFKAILALGVSLALQVATNYANDYSDGIKGTDKNRAGPLRLVASGLKSPKAVKKAAYVFFLVAGVLGFILALLTSFWLIVVGAAAILAGWFYTGGPKPYGYYGYGELFVFVFFGLVAVVGTAFVQMDQLTFAQFVVAVPVGISSVCLLVVNNLRDIPSDSESGKRTLAVRFGDATTRKFFIGLIAAMFLIVLLLTLIYPFAFLGLLAIPLAVSPVKAILNGARGAGLIPALGNTGKMQLALAVCLFIGIAL